MSERPERTLTVTDPGALTTVQDLGRPGHAHLGVPRSGALDPVAHRRANRLVGNPPGAAALETTATGVSFRLAGAGVVAVTGAVCRVRVGGREVDWGLAVSVPAGAEVVVGPATQGLRASVAVAGGIAVPEVLGSRSTDLLSGIGPAPLAAGDVLPVGPATGHPPGVDTPVPFRRTTTLRVRLGPRDDWFADPAVLDRSTYRVGEASNRIGLRLEGPALERTTGEELASEPMVLGAVQVPPTGQPVVLLADHATTGGYPVVGVVLAQDLPGCAQLRPGEEVSVRLV